MTTEEKLKFIEEHHQDALTRLKRLLDRKTLLMDRNAYGERFTDRQFDLVFKPLVEAAYIRARLLAAVSREAKTVGRLAGELSLATDTVFNHLKELLRKNMIEVSGKEDRYPLFRKR